MPTCLVFGSANFYGRALTQLLCRERQQSTDTWEIRGVDKILPQLASFPADVLALYSTIDYRMGNLRCRGFLEQAFQRDDGKPWDFVFNFAAEHKFGQSDQVYDQDVRQLSANIAALASQHSVGVLVQLSTALIFAATSNSQCAEDSVVDGVQTTVMAKCHVDAEASARQAGVPVVILRPALCYGPGDRQNAVPMLIMAQLSKQEGDNRMPVLWDKDLRISTVHVSDVAAAALASARWHYNKSATVVFNLADSGDTTNARLAQAVGGLFGVEPSFQNVAVNFIVKRLKTAELAEEVNQSLLGPWMDLLAANGVSNSPLSPYLDQEHPYCRLDSQPRGVDGSRIANTSGLKFEYQYPRLSPAALREMVEEFQAVGLWPAIPI
ncbi:hypothetical protein GGI13_000740 [Coemansia sp. RSA 455]|nr:hypothetical protein LPJ71_000841 [Coemansia sp. S17]KAJ2017944.1 hypothetical protein GGI14_002652 [Coemansia sp. S680]KAJ2052466.1 hypothetical protein H4S04_001314 [Coemansia sp. S16]KAJ2068793.1 hypothetical protein GGI08_000687 [Coemansia sp. S2]KAJ2074508.1 hypothetical protein GGI09_008766 [Coemansia sp. S100]KAJ2081670.1 hypothetical protein GGI16_007444 [Coemansia sp. S142-1]KAJ2257951.1 hypothetical protein GGI13_000740 [Coemansia sp. RSA 455]